MSGTTATWQIPFATSGDRLCDLDDITRSMANRVDDIMCNFDADLVFLNNIPAARVSLTNTVNMFTIGGCTSPVGVFWDTIDYDTNSMVNFGVDLSIITYKRAGYFVLGAGVNFTEAPAAAGEKYTATLFSTAHVEAPVAQMARDPGNNAMGKTMSGINQFAGPVTGLEGEIDLELCRQPGSNGSPAVVAPSGSFMYARWFSDL